MIIMISYPAIWSTIKTNRQPYYSKHFYSFHHPFYVISYSITQNFANFNLPIIQEKGLRSLYPSINARI
jgi:oligoendopeptidase F